MKNLFIRCLLGWLCFMVLPAGAAEQKDNAMEKTTTLGPVTARVNLTPAKPRLGDNMTLTLTVEASKGVELLMPEFGQAMDRFAIVDFVPREETGSQGQTRAIQRYTLQTPMSGNQAIPPLILEFVDHRPGNRPAPEGEDAYELLTERLPFKVESVLPQGATAELNPPLSALPPLGTASSRWGWLWLLLLALPAAPWTWRRWQTWQGGVRQRSAFDVAYARFMKLKTQPRPGPEAMDPFFVQLSDIIRRYLEERFQLRAPEKTTEEFLEVAATSPDLTAEHRGFLYQFLAYADQVKFARHRPNATQVEQALEAAGRFLEQTRETEAIHG